MIDRIENILKTILQEQISITVKNKTVKHGRLVIFRTIGCYIRLELANTLRNGAVKKEHIEIPFPYAVSVDRTGSEPLIQFDYRLVTLADGDSDTLALLQSQVQVKESKYYDRVLTIATHNGN